LRSAADRIEPAGGRLRQGHLWDLVRRLARTAGVGAWEQLSPHSLRHSAITFALDAGASLRDVQDYADHKDPRTTRRYDHSRDSLDRKLLHSDQYGVAKPWCCLPVRAWSAHDLVASGAGVPAGGRGPGQPEGGDRCQPGLPPVGRRSGRARRGTLTA
jgi:hypothetical protein